ncbi:MAG: S1 RNA-binding domain-containing protein, partial [Persicimonas sp.]
MAENEETKKSNGTQDEVDSEEPTVRRRVKVSGDAVEEEKAEGAVPAEAKDQDESAPSGGKKDYQTEHQAGSKVRVARSIEGMPSQSSGESKGGDASEDGDDDAPNEGEPSPARPGRRTVDMSKKDESSEPSQEADAGGESTEAPADTGEEAGEGDDAKERQETSDEDEQPAVEEPSKPQIDTSDIDQVEPDVSTEDFEALLAGQALGGSPQTQDIAAGDRITGTVAAIGEKYIFVEFGSSKGEGVATREDFETEEGELEIEEGEEREFYVLGIDGDEIRLGEKLAGREGALEAIRNAHDTGVPVEGRVDATNKGGFEVVIGGIRAFCPVSQIELGYTEEPKIHVGNTYRFRVEKVDDRGRNVVVSRAALLEEERAAKREETLASLEEGEVVTGKVTRVAEFGAFVDVGGIEGLVHVSELAHGYFDEPSDVVQPGETVEVKILEIDQKDEDDVRISLSRKETEGDPWDKVNETLSVGEKVEGEVVRLAPFGAFVEVIPGVDGLVHVSEMSWTEHVKHPRDVVRPGESVMVEVQDIDQAKKRISLSMKDAEGDPWQTAPDKYARGDEVTGLVENIEDFGVFVRLDSGITAL